MLVACAPTRAAIPITWLATDGNAKREDMVNVANLVIEDIALKNHIKDFTLFKELLHNALSSKYVIAFGEESRLKRAQRYFSYSEFKQVLDSYYIREGDANIYKPSWSNYFSFGKEYKEIDGNFLSSKLISILFNIDEEIVNEDFKSGQLEKFLTDNGIDLELYKSTLFAKEAVVALTCNVNYSFGKGSYGFKFNYNNGKVENFEFL